MHEGDNDAEDAQKSYYLLKNEVQTFMSRKAVSVDRTPVRVDRNQVSNRRPAFSEDGNAILGRSVNGKEVDAADQQRQRRQRGSSGRSTRGESGSRGSEGQRVRRQQSSGNPSDHYHPQSASVQEEACRDHDARSCGDHGRSTV